jgi:hypothetical protein
LPQSVQQAAQQAGITPNQFRGVTMPKGQVFVVHDKHSSQAWVTTEGAVLIDNDA